jgi:hypothetical protein
LDFSFSGGVAGDSCSEFSGEEGASGEGGSCEDKESSGSSASGKLFEHKNRPVSGKALGIPKGTEDEESPARCSRAEEETNCLAH